MSITNVIVQPAINAAPENYPVIIECDCGTLVYETVRDYERWILTHRAFNHRGSPNHFHCRVYRP